MTNDNTPAKPIKEKCAEALNEFVGMFMDAGMSTFEIADVIEAELPKLRRPFANPAENDPA
jgi:hypothetical protein